MTEEGIMGACKQTNIYDFIVSLPNGLLFLVDQATSALDIQSEKALANGRIPTPVACRLSTIEDADIVFVFFAGRMVESAREA
ncbi:ABC multidrug transporter MDR1 [Colletotrichum tofieldiae]|uniref:ABC multidrug transporter MDR1 n=1 Tax=Colletotrichum tofieldiae TaxID=708197 RepID=A0A166NSP3_9PEZI|nr:ABC multidrug transporter MDR1 [Colletotrichum tofieldiae]